jgi:DMSO/TMAO reductase YedYZ heme-binding membrane subunit
MLRSTHWLEANPKLLGAQDPKVEKWRLMVDFRRLLALRAFLGSLVFLHFYAPV